MSALECLRFEVIIDVDNLKISDFIFIHLIITIPLNIVQNVGLHSVMEINGDSEEQSNQRSEVVAMTKSEEI